MIERVQSKLEGWKSKCLSPAGRLFLLKAVVSPIPEYFMQCCKLPARVCEDIDRLVRNFLWGSTSNKKKIHLVGWNKVTNPKELGGLEIFQAKARNSALLAKLCWRIASCPDMPWAHMLICKYLTPSRLGVGGRKLPASRIWAACKDGGVIFNKGLKWSIANGNMVKAWGDFWLPSGPLRHQIEGPLTEGEENISVKMLLDNWSSISFILPDNIVKEIQGTPSAVNSNQEDILVWAFSKDGSFSLKSAYLLAKGLNPLNLEASPGHWVWKTITTPRIKFFLWLCVHHSIPTLEVLCSRGMNLNTSCELCGLASESILHTLRDCEKARGVWKDLGFDESNAEFFNLSLTAWLEKYCGSSDFFPTPRIPWKILFPQTLWNIWLRRNNVIFHGRNVESGLSALCIKRSAEFFAIVPNVPSKPNRIQVQVKWCKPQPGWMKLNTDGSVFGDPKRAGGGGVIRNSEGEWVAGFVRKFGNVSSITAELWAFKEGLLMAKQLGIDNLYVDLDAAFLVHLITNPSVVNLNLEPLLSDCRNLTKTFLNCLVTHVYREANYCADRLAKMGADLHTDYLFLYNPPPVVADLLALDKAGHVCNRLILP